MILSVVSKMGSVENKIYIDLALIVMKKRDYFLLTILEWKKKLFKAWLKKNMTVKFQNTKHMNMCIIVIYFS